MDLQDLSFPLESADNGPVLDWGALSTGPRLCTSKL